MGNSIKNDSSREIKIIMTGNDYAGKTTIEYWYRNQSSKLFQKEKEPIKVIPMIGVNVESFRCQEFSFVEWDCTRHDMVMRFLKIYYLDTDAIIFVFDVSERDYLVDQARTNLWALLSEEILKDAVLLVFANKQDKENKMSNDEVIDVLELNRIEDRKWTIIPSIAIKGEGLEEGLKWISENIKSEYKTLSDVNIQI